MVDVRDKVAVVTGGSRGIGAGLARVFQRQGMRVATCSRSPEPPEGVAQETGRALHRSVDVQDLVALEAFARDAADELGPLDLWVNNAGLLAPIGMARDVDPAAWGLLIGVNVVGVYHGARTFLRHLHRHGRKGCLVNIGSGAATNAYQGWSAYCASKAAVDQLTRVLAEEEREAGIRVFSLAPGVIATSMQELIRNQDEGSFPQVEKFKELHDQGILLDPESPADLILDLAFGPQRDPVEDPCLDARDLRGS
jgi:NAD(P)-dependent dehydrogenase (short-subunit alcohol dehydrogenase family)